MSGAVAKVGSAYKHTQRDLSYWYSALNAGLNCLLQYFDVPEAVLPVQQQPSLVLSAEADLGITAGLQDRVIQVKECHHLQRSCQCACAVHTPAACCLFSCVFPVMLWPCVTD